VPVAKPNFSFQKRQKEQARERKKQEKMLRKQERANNQMNAEPDPLAAPEAALDVESGGATS
jgi:hypothetical protein